MRTSAYVGASAILLLASTNLIGCASETVEANDPTPDSGNTEQPTPKPQPVPPQTDPCDNFTTAVSCGGTCTTTSQCPANSNRHCAFPGVCVQQCSDATLHCGTDEICTPYGRCARTQPDPNQNICGAVVQQATFTIPTVMLLVDKSGSMGDSYASGQSRWAALESALVDAQNGLVKQYEDTVRFGLTLYSGASANQCPALSTVTPALNNFASIETTFANNSPGGATPTGASTQRLLDDILVPYSEPGQKFIILATDGEPNTCADSSDNAGGRDESLTAAQNAYTAGVEMFILSVGSGNISQNHLQDLANAGVGLPQNATPPAPFYEPNDPAALQAAFDTIIGQVLSCTVKVNGTLAEDAAGFASVYVDGDLVPNDAINGWKWVNSNTIQLMGTTCDLVQQGGQHAVAVEYPCFDPPA